MNLTKKQQKSIIRRERIRMEMNNPDIAKTHTFHYSYIFNGMPGGWFTKPKDTQYKYN